MLLLLLIMPGRNRGKPNFPRFQGNIFRETFLFISVILPKIVSDFTVGRLSENVKYCLSGSMTAVCNKGAQGGGLQMRNIYHISIFDHKSIWTSYTIGLISMCKNHDIFVKRRLFALCILPFFNIPDMTRFISPLLMLSWSKFPLEVFSVR